MTTPLIPMIEARGTHRQVGRQLGEQMRPSIQALVEALPADLPAGVSWSQMLAQSDLYLAHSRAVYPQYVDELQGLAEGAGVAFEPLYLSICEELWEAAAWQRGCTDMAARGAATLNGDVLLAHTNDLLPKSEAHLAIVKAQAGDEPEFLGVSPGGAGYSAGFNAAGICLTGNQVENNDIRPGVPRMLVVRAILGSRRLGEAIDACLLPQRASSYNNIIADAHGEIYSMEGSATDCEPIYIEGDILAHANHYISAPMRKFEALPAEVGGSVIRHNRAMRLLRENYGSLSPELFRELLADHQNYPASICKHGAETVTVFGMIVQLNELRAWIGRGRPCQTEWHAYQLAPWAPPADWIGNV